MVAILDNLRRQHTGGRHADKYVRIDNDILQQARLYLNDPMEKLGEDDGGWSQIGDALVERGGKDVYTPDHSGHG